MEILCEIAVLEMVLMFIYVNVVGEYTSIYYSHFYH